jgi:hypothetical protein
MLTNTSGYPSTGLHYYGGYRGVQERRILPFFIGISFALTSGPDDCGHKIQASKTRRAAFGKGNLSGDAEFAGAL